MLAKQNFSKKKMFFQQILFFKQHFFFGIQKNLTKTKKKEIKIFDLFYLPYYYSGTGVGLNFYAGENALLNIKEYYPSTLKRGLEKYLVRD